MNSMVVWRLRLFGSASLARGDGSAAPPKALQRHRLALLALLAAAPGARLTRDKLMALLWPEASPARARNLLNVSVYVLRNALGEGVLVREGDELRLGADLVSDVQEFEAALVEGNPSAAAALHRAPFLDGFFLPDAADFEEWASRERERLGRLYAAALESLAATAAAAGDAPGAAGLWQERAAHDPGDSRVALRLIEALDAAGNRAGALHHAAAHRRLLHDDLGMEPPPELEALTQRLRAAPAAAPARGAFAASTPSEPSGPATRAERKAPAAAVPLQSRGRMVWLPALGTISALALAGWLELAPAPAPPAGASIVVLPFAALSPVQADEHFADGLTEELIGRLSAAPELRVISRTTAMRYKGSAEPLEAIAGKLRVARVLQGSVRRSGDSLRVTAHLMDPADDRQLWTGTYDYAARDLFRVQDAIASDVARAFRVSLDSATRPRPRGTRDAEAYALYQRGRYLWNVRTPDAHRQAVEHFHHAIARDSSYAEPYAGLADAHLTAWLLGLSDATEEETYSRVKWAAERALALDDHSADAHTSFAIVLWCKRNWPGAVRELTRALELNPGHAGAREAYALLLGGMGRTDEALREALHAWDVDPFAAGAAATVADLWYQARNYDSALAQYHRAIELSPGSHAYRLGAARTYAQLGRYAEAARAAQSVLAVMPAHRGAQAHLAYIRARAGDTAAAHRLLAGVKRQDGDGIHVARVYAALGQRDSAFAWLELERNAWQWPFRATRADPALDPIRFDPRFVELSERIDQEMGLR